MRVIKTGHKPQPQKGLSDIEVIHGYHELEEQLGLRKSNSLIEDLEIPQLTPIPQGDSNET